MNRKILALVTALCCASAAFAAGGHSTEALKIKSDNLHADSEKKTATFEGKVVAHQGDLTLYTDRLVIRYTDDGKDLSKVEAFGRVRIVQGAREALGAHAVYDNKLGRIVLDGSPKVLQGDDVITGQSITYYVDEQRSVVTGGPNEQVHAVINPRGNNVGAKP